MEKEKKILVISIDSKMAEVLQMFGDYYARVHGGELLVFHILEFPDPTPISQDYDLSEILPEESYNDLCKDLNDLTFNPSIIRSRDIEEAIKDEILEHKPDLLISDFDEVEKLDLDHLISKKIVIYDIEKKEDDS